MPINDNLEPVGVSKETEPDELKEIELSKVIKRKYQNRVHFTFWDRVRLTWRGETDVGKALGIGLDIAESFAPQWVAKTRTLIQHNQRPMVQKMPFQYVYVYNDTATNDELVSLHDRGTATTILDGEDLTLDFDDANGLLDLS